MPAQESGMNKKAKIDLGLPPRLSRMLLEANVRGSNTSEIEMKLNERTRSQIISYLQLSLLNLQQSTTADSEFMQQLHMHQERASYTTLLRDRVLNLRQ
jgi:hypothetical protein